jgi:hypothetical protein
MKSFNVTEVAILYSAKMHRVVRPFFKNVTLYRSSQKYGECINRSYKAQRRGDKEEGQEIRNHSRYMSGIPWPFMMFKVKGVESFVRPFSYNPFSIREMDMQYVSVKKVFNKGPVDDACNKEKSRDQRMF